MPGDDDDELRINTLHRFAKHSPRLVLHEYSHCEVPAGCGGVVLRWIDPQLGHPATARLEAPGARGTLWLDGKRLDSSLHQLRAGTRVFALHVTRTNPIGQPFALAIELDTSPALAVPIAAGRCSTSPPPDDWTDPAFDDRAWPAAPLATPELLARQESWVQRGAEYRAGRGIATFALERDELWVRFVVAVRGPA